MRKAAVNVIPVVTVNVELITPPYFYNLTSNHPPERSLGGRL